MVLSVVIESVVLLLHFRDASFNLLAQIAALFLKLISFGFNETETPYVDLEFKIPFTLTQISPALLARQSLAVKKLVGEKSKK